jgi:predicted Zn finger-like uncharacterized protein
MIITCPSCLKKFEIDRSLIPNEGRNLQCGSCDKIWFYNLKDQTTREIPVEKKEDNPHQDPIVTEEISNFDNATEDLSETKTDINQMFQYSQLEEIENSPQHIKTISKISLGNILSYFIVFLISFIALIIFLDTFKSPLEKFFPSLEFLLYNLFESLKDVFIFINDLIV